MQTQIQTGCPICFPSNIKCEKTSLILLKLIKIMEKEKTKQRKLISLPSEQYFKQLVDYLTLEMVQNVKILQNCCHRKLKSYLSKKLTISVEQLYCFSQHLYNSLSKRKFELQLIQKMAKNVHQQVYKTDMPSKNQLYPHKKNKNSSQYEVKTLHSFGSQKVIDNKSQQDNLWFINEFNQINERNPRQFLEQYGFSIVNYGAQSNNYYSIYGGTGFQNQQYTYPFQGLQVLVQNGYFVPTLSSMNN